MQRKSRAQSGRVWRGGVPPRRPNVVENNSPDAGRWNPRLTRPLRPQGRRGMFLCQRDIPGRRGCCAVGGRAYPRRPAPRTGNRSVRTAYSASRLASVSTSWAETAVAPFRAQAAQHLGHRRKLHVQADDAAAHHHLLDRRAAPAITTPVRPYRVKRSDTSNAYSGISVRRGTVRIAWCVQRLPVVLNWLVLLINSIARGKCGCDVDESRSASPAPPATPGTPAAQALALRTHALHLPDHLGSATPIPW